MWFVLGDELFFGKLLNVLAGTRIVLGLTEPLTVLTH